jgi:predicted glycosyltransferase involved in capsule biosynthesis
MIKIYIPYNNDKQCVYREQAFSNVYKYYSSIDDFEVKILSSTPFSRAAARNAVFEDRLEDNETVFFSDADIITPEPQIREAVNKASETGEMVLAYSELSKLNAQESREYLLTRELKKSKKLIKNQCSGSFAIPVDLLMGIGGYDERFFNWGCEDRVFYFIAAYFADREFCQRVPGIAYHFFHPRSENAGRRFLVSNPLFSEYLQAFGISVHTFRKYKESKVESIERLMGESKKYQGKYKKEIIPFKVREVVKFTKGKKVVLVLKNTEQYKRLKKAKGYKYEGVGI